MTLRSRLYLAHCIVLAGLLPVLLWVIAFWLGLWDDLLVLNRILLPYLFPLLVVPGLVVSAPAIWWSNRLLRQIDGHHSKLHRVPQVLGATLLLTALFGLLTCFVPSLQLALHNPKGDLGIFNAVLRNDGRANWTLINGDINLGKTFLPDFIVSLDCGGSPAPSADFVLVDFLKSAGFQASKTLRSPDKSFESQILAIDDRQRQIAIRLTPSKGQLRIELLSTPPTKHDEPFEDRLQKAASTLPGCRIRKVIRNDNGPASRAMFEFSAVETRSLVTTGKTVDIIPPSASP